MFICTLFEGFKIGVTWYLCAVHNKHVISHVMPPVGIHTCLLEQAMVQLSQTSGYHTYNRIFKKYNHQPCKTRSAN